MLPIKIRLDTSKGTSLLGASEAGSSELASMNRSVAVSVGAKEGAVDGSLVLGATEGWPLGVKLGIDDG
jgi:hypothetical protein